jgi:multidrug efflux system outer membrane protein
MSNGAGYLLALMALSFAGCTMVPKYERPNPPVSHSWPTEPAQTDQTRSAADIDWREFFDDPRLQRLIALALTNNRDLRVAALRMEQARAQYRIQLANLYPAVQGDASVVRQRFSGAATTFNQGSIITTYTVDVGASYELDLFGRIRSLKREALEKYLASDQARISTHISLVSEVATE